MRVADGTEYVVIQLLLERSKEVSSGVKDFVYIFQTYLNLIKFCIFSFEFMNRIILFECQKKVSIIHFLY